MFRSRSLRRYEARRVVVTLDNGTGVRGFLKHVYRDHVALVESQGLVPDPNGGMLAESVQPGECVIPRRRIVRLLTVPE